MCKAIGFLISLVIQHILRNYTMDLTSFAAGALVGLGFWGWFVILAWFIFLFICAANDLGVVGFASGVIISCFLWWFYDLNIFGVIYAHPVYTLLFVVAYLSFGALWSLWKWKRFVKNEKECFAERLKEKQKWYIDQLSSSNRHLDQWLDENHISISVGERDSLITELKTGKIPEALLNDFRRTFQPRLPTWKHNKDRLATWIILWPWSVAWYFIADLIRELGQKIAAQLRGLYEKIVASEYKDIDPRLFKDDE
jgi:hypothetical protein